MERCDLEPSGDRHDASDAAASGSPAVLKAERLPPVAAGDAVRLLQRLSAVTEILHGWIWETDDEHRFTYLSDSVTRFSGKPPEWHYGKTRMELGNQTPDVSQHHIYMKQLDAREMFGPIEFVRYQDGSQFWMRTIGLPQFDAQGRFTGYCGVAFDISAEIERRQGNRRSEPRHRVARSATISEHNAPRPIPCVVLDISKGGARLELPNNGGIPHRFMLNFELDGEERLCEVVWRKDTSVGVRFVDPSRR